MTNTCGGTTQPNAWRDDWVEFFLEQRIGHQLRTAGDGTLNDEWAKVRKATNDLRSLFEGVEVRPSLRLRLRLRLRVGFGARVRVRDRVQVRMKARVDQPYP